MPTGPFCGLGGKGAVFAIVAGFTALFTPLGIVDVGATVVWKTTGAWFCWVCAFPYVAASNAAPAPCVRGFTVPLIEAIMSDKFSGTYKTRDTEYAVDFKAEKSDDGKEFNWLGG
jgi:hypothetical protein